ncbi:hypothetical protein BGZ76_010038 [Entomortierella beljakovae]|nr:hypothetical protein BGZ76_010038 [Entomortierella beljakovae]
MTPHTEDTLPSSNTLWSVHVIASCALVKDIDAERDDINDPSYFITTLANGDNIVTEWTPELRLGVKIAIDTIPNVCRQAWHYIGLDSAEQVLSEIVAIENDQLTNTTCMSNDVQIKPVILNFTDGMEVDKWPGISVIRGLERLGLAFTGVNSTLYSLDSDKALIKQHLINSGTPTPGYCNIYPRSRIRHNKSTTAISQEEEEEEDEEEVAKKAEILSELSKLRFPLLIKPANSSSSRGISTKSVVDTPEEAYERAMETKRIWGPVYAEEYITGREYTTLVSGSNETEIKVYKVLERVFRTNIPERERMLTHEMKWGEDNYGTDETIETASWWMRICSDIDQERLQPLAKSIYASFGGNGYCRMDLREDQRSGEVYVVDVNANCSIDEDEDCAMGKILKASGLSLGMFFSIIMEDAVLVQETMATKADNYIAQESLKTNIYCKNIDQTISATSDGNTDNNIIKTALVEA